jgi:hypothetical protein
MDPSNCFSIPSLSSFLHRFVSLLILALSLDL